jgi:tripartite-type tricarboxylate transporter receptor subunit TctC
MGKTTLTRNVMKRSSLFHLVLRSTAIVAFAALAIPMTSPSAMAQNYPTRTIRLVVHSSPGGSSDILGRMVAQKLTESFGQQVVVENRAGASGIIGVEVAVKAPPDGYTLLVSQTSLAINPSMFRKLPYEAMRDLVPITQMVDGPNVLVVHPSVPARSVKQLIALARSKPDSLVIGSPGQGTSPHLSAELFNAMAGVKMVQVQYKGAGMALVGLISGEIGVMLPTTPTAMASIKAKRIIPLGVTTAKRVGALPDVPTIAEAGLPGYESTQWFGILAPAGTPRPIIDRLNQEIVRIMHGYKERLSGEGMEVVAGTPEAFAAHIKMETEKWAKVIKAMGLKPE